MPTYNNPSTHHLDHLTKICTFFPGSTPPPASKFSLILLFVAHSCYMIRSYIFEIEAMPFPCNGHVFCCVNIPTVLLMFFNKFASCSIPYFNSNFFNQVYFSLDLGKIIPNFFQMYININKANKMSCNMIHQKKMKKTKFAKTNFINQSIRPLLNHISY